MSTSFHRRGMVRALLTGGAVTAVALLPGAAWAADDPADPLGGVTGTAEDLLQDPTGDEAGGEGDPSEAVVPPEGGEDPPDPAEELQKLIDDFRAQFPENECVDGVAAALEDLLALIVDPEAFAEYRAEFEAYVAEVTALLEGIDPTAPALPELPDPPAPPEGMDPAEFQAAIEELVAALEACQPEQPGPPTEQPEEPETPAFTPPSDTGGTPAPVTYPGYAPTGASTDTGAAPLPALGGVLLLLGAAGAVGSRMRTRATRGED